MVHKPVLKIPQQLSTGLFDLNACDGMDFILTAMRLFTNTGMVLIVRKKYTRTAPNIQYTKQFVVEIENTTQGALICQGPSFLWRLSLLQLELLF